MARRTRTRRGGWLGLLERKAPPPSIPKYKELIPLSDREFIQQKLKEKKKMDEERAETKAWNQVINNAPKMAEERERMRAEAAIIKDARSRNEARRVKQHAADMAAAAAALKGKYPLLEPLPEGGGRKSRRRRTRKGRRRKTKKGLRKRKH